MTSVPVRRWAAATILALPVLLSPADARAQDPAQAGPPRLSEIRFEGNETFPSDSLEVVLRNRESECRSPVFQLLLFCPLGFDFARDERLFHQREFPGDVLRLKAYYSERGFREARVDTVVQRPSEDQVKVLFRIEEGPPVIIRSLEVIGAAEIPGMAANDLPVQEGDRFSRPRMTAALDSLTRRLRNQGYYDAFVSRDTDYSQNDPYAIDVRFRVDPGPLVRFGEITLEGNELLSDRVIRRMLPFETGQVYSRALRTEGQRNLYNLDLIRSATVSDTLDVERGVVPVRVSVAEGDLHRVRMGAGWSTSECFNQEGRWTSRNFLGGARQLTLRTRLSNEFAESLERACGQAGRGDFGGLNWLVSAEFVQPWVFDQRYQFRANLFYERQSLQDVFVRRGIGIDLRLARQVGPYTQLSVFYRPELTELEAAEVYFCTSFLACAPSDIQTLQGNNWLSPVGVDLIRDRSDDLLNPTEGYALSLQFEHASGFTGSDFGYNRVTGEAALYRRLSPGHVIALRGAAGWVGSGSFGLLGAIEDPIIHPEKRFFVGGANSVRGFAQNQLGPRVLTVDVARLVQPPEGDPICEVNEILALTCDAGSLPSGDFDTPRPTGGKVMVQGGAEYRFPLFSDHFQGAAFLDVGRVWADSERGDDTRWEFTPGFGFRYLSPIGPLRLDLGYRFIDRQPLQVVTSQLRFPREGEDLSLIPDEQKIDFMNGDVFVITEELAVLEPRVPFGPDPGFSLGRFQIHFSIGQAF